MSESVLQGHKDSHIARIPKGWEVVRLNELLELLTDFEANGSFADVKENVTVKEQVDYAWYVRATDLENKLSLSKVKYVDRHSYEFLKKTTLFGDEVLVTKRGEIGKVYFFNPKGIKATLAPNLYLLKLNKRIIPKLLYYYFISDVGNNSLKRINASTTLGALYKDDVKKLLIPLPNSNEQIEIASILTSVDTVIEKTEAQINKLKDLKKAMMQELLTKGIGHTEFKDSPVGRIPKGWKAVTIDSVLNNLIDYRGKSPPKDTVGVPLITAKNIRVGYIDPEPREYISAEKYDEWMVKGIPSTGDILFTTEAPLGNLALVPDYKFAIGQRVLAVCPQRQTLNPLYMLYVLQWEIVRKQLFLDSTGSTVTGVKQSTFRKILINLPSLTEQQKIASILISLDTNIDEIQKKLSRTKSLKKGLMQDLLTGKVRVSP